jgi:hypothetical protein
VHVEELTLAPVDAGRYHVFRRRSLIEPQAAPNLPSTDPLRLRVEVADRTLKLVKVQEVEVPMDLDLSSRILDWPEGIAAACGLVGYQGSVVFEQSAVCLLP